MKLARSGYQVSKVKVSKFDFRDELWHSLLSHSANKDGDSVPVLTGVGSPALIY